MISMKKVSKRYKSVEALKQVTLTVNKGSVYGLVGPNGAGKTTLLKLIAGIYKQDGGEVMVGQDQVFENIKVKDRMVFIPDTPYFFTNYTIQSMAAFYKSVYSGWNDDRFEQLQNVFDIDLKNNVNRLSKGMQRQVAFWLALSTMPEVMILDEPIDGLDPIIRKKIKNLLIQEVAERQMTVLISSHNLRELEDMCDHIGILHKGALIVQKDLDELKCDIHKIQAAFKQDVPETLAEGIEIVHQEQNGSFRNYIVRGQRERVTAHFQKYDPVILDVIPLTLEEVFIYEMGDLGYEIKNIILS